MSATYSANQSRKPQTITLSLRNGSRQAKELPGLIERTDVGVKLIFALPGGEGPTGFKTQKGQVMYTLEPAK